MYLVDRRSKLWAYLPEEIRGLISDGENLVEECPEMKGRVSDYSHLVFPFAKGYEGFLKHLFLDLGLIREEEFYGDDIRIGRILNPYFKDKDYSVYSKLRKHSSKGSQISERLWNIWKRGRNQVFHYFPHNFRRLSEHEAQEIIKEFLGAMEEAVGVLNKSKQ